MHILFLPTYLGGTFSPLLDISERNFLPRWGGGARASSAPPPPAYAPELTGLSSTSVGPEISRGTVWAYVTQIVKTAFKYLVIMKPSKTAASLLRL